MLFRSKDFRALLPCTGEAKVKLPWYHSRCRWSSGRSSAPITEGVRCGVLGKLCSAHCSRGRPAKLPPLPRTVRQLSEGRDLRGVSRSTQYKAIFFYDIFYTLIHSQSQLLKCTESAGPAKERGPVSKLAGPLKQITARRPCRGGTPRCSGGRTWPWRR